MDIDWDITILKSGPLGGDHQMESLIVENKIDYLFFFIDPMTMQPHDTDIKALTRLASVQNMYYAAIVLQQTMLSPVHYFLKEYHPI